MERVPRRPHIANNENRFSFIVATPVASHQPMNEKRQTNKANGSSIVGYARAENGADGRQHKAVGAQVGVGAACRKEFVAKRQRLQDRAKEQTPSSEASAVSRRSRG